MVSPFAMASFFPEVCYCTTFCSSLSACPACLTAFCVPGGSVDEILQAAEVSSDEEEDGASQQPRPARRKANSAAWIREDSESIVDLLDPKASRQVTGEDMIDIR